MTRAAAAFAAWLVLGGVLPGPFALARAAEQPAAPPAAGEAQGQEASEFDQFEDTGTAAAQAPKEVFDPLRGYNRAMFQVNDRFYFWLAKPLTRGYGFLVPKPGRVALQRGFSNLRFPLRFVNCLLQVKMRRAGAELGRFLVNSTLGLGGLFDPAEAWLSWKRPPEEDFGQTLGHYGVGHGFPVVLPILGASNLRDGLALAPNFLVNPLYYVADFETNLGVAAADEFNYVSLHIGEYESIKKDALDPYTFIRDAHKQKRDKSIRQ